jgi:serine/threonine-protein kinase
MAGIFKTYPKFWRTALILSAVFLFGFLLSNFVMMPWVVRRGAVVEMPELKGLTFDQARELLSQKGLDIMLAGWQYDPGIPDSSVSMQEPEPKMMVKIGRKVKVVLSRGTEKIAVPYLVGLSSVRAINLLDRSGLKVDGIDSLASDSVALGCVVCSNPPYLAQLVRESGVRLTLSSGPTEGKMLMPDLMGKKLAEVQGSLVAQGLVIGQIKYLPGQSAEPGTIIMQAPQPGFVIKGGDTVNMAVSAN